MTKSEVCNDHHVFPRDTFTRMPKAEVWCDKPKDHKGAHEGVRGTVAYCWSVESVEVTE